jgi:hypothetical protein
MRTRLALLATLALTGAAAAPAAADTLSCGAVVTHDTVLDADVDCFAGPVITIGASDITLDLNGHTVDAVFGTGIASEGNDRVTVRNGTVITQGVAITLSGDGNVMRNLSGFGDGGGFELHRGSGSRVINVAMGRTIGPGGILRHERNVTVERSNSDTIRFDHTDHSTVHDSTGGGVILDAQSERNTIVRNHFERLGALIVNGDRNRIAHNVLGGNSPRGPLAVSGDHNQVVWNRVRNVFGDGIHVTGAANLIRGNGAFANQDLGIFAAAGNTDGGANRASGNGDPRQCVGVVCTP